MGRETNKRPLKQAQKEQGTRNDIKTRGNREFAKSNPILLCEDTSSAYYYFKYFNDNCNLGLIMQPKVTQTLQGDDKLGKLFKKAQYFIDESNTRDVFVIFDTDEFYREKNPHTSNKKAFEKFVEINKENEHLILCDSFPCFEYWLLIHLKQSTKYFDSYDNLLHDLISEMKKVDTKADYQKSKEWWKETDKIVEKYFDKDKRKKAMSFSEKNYDKENTSHTKIYRFFKYFSSQIDGNSTD